MAATTPRCCRLHRLFPDALEGLPCMSVVAEATIRVPTVDEVAAALLAAGEIDKACATTPCLPCASATCVCDCHRRGGGIFRAALERVMPGLIRAIQDEAPIQAEKNRTAFWTSQGPCKCGAPSSCFV